MPKSILDVRGAPPIKPWRQKAAKITPEQLAQGEKIWGSSGGTIGFYHMTVDPTKALVINGHNVTSAQWLAFRTVALGRSNQQTREFLQRKFGVTVKAGTIARWKNEHWWITLWNEWIADEQRNLYSKLLRKQDKAEAAFEGIMDGDAKYSKTSNAVIQGVRTLLEGAASPVLSKGPQVQINSNNRTLNQQNNLTVQQVEERAAQMSQEDLLLWQATGEVPSAPIDVTPSTDGEPA